MNKLSKKIEVEKIIEEAYMVANVSSYEKFHQWLINKYVDYQQQIDELIEKDELYTDLYDPDNVEPF
jgi:hypothetical protein